MAKALKSLGLDLGTATTQLVVSELTVEDRSSGFTVPRMEITDRRLLYQSPIHFTPLLSGELVDGQALSRLLEQEYAAAGITPEDLDTGAVIVTGETSRKENARTVLEALSRQAGKFVVATAGPDLESILAARGAGAAARSEEIHSPVIHLDIGGGTANLALCQKGEVTAAGCLNVGGRLARFDGEGRVLWVSPALKGLVSWTEGTLVSEEEAFSLAQKLAGALEEALGLVPETDLSRQLRTPGAVEVPLPQGEVSFSGGVADCIDRDQPWLAFGDMGPVLGRAIRESRLCAGEYILGRETIRATVIGAGCHSAQLSGSTVFYRNVEFPLKNLPVVQVKPRNMGPGLGEFLVRELEKQEISGMISLPQLRDWDYSGLRKLAGEIIRAVPEGPILLCMEQDMAKALGQILALELPRERPLLCLDRVRLSSESYLDVGAPVGPALPVVVKTLVMNS